MARDRRIVNEASASIPMRSVGPVAITGPVLSDEIFVPLATFETPLWPSVERGARVTAKSGGIQVVIADDRMARSILLEMPDAAAAVSLTDALAARRDELIAAASQSSNYARMIGLNHQIVGNLVYLRLEITTGDAAGHNMVTLAAEAVCDWITDRFPDARYVSLSGNYCTDKKVSAVNGILGRGKYVIAEATISSKLCSRYLKTSPAELVAINIKKNLIGSIIAGGVRSANAHFANMLLAFYLATGQDAANIVEGSQGLVHTEVRGDGLYFSCTLPNLIVGTVGNGKDLDFVQQNLEQLGCAGAAEPGDNARRLAAICAATVLCGELSLLAALTNPGELMQAHTRLERNAGDE